MDALEQADDVILEYFSRPFEIIDRVGHMNRFLFPFIGELIERLLHNKNNHVERILREAIKHNQYVYDQLAALMADALRLYKEYGYDLTNEALKTDLTKGILRDLDFSLTECCLVFLQCSQKRKGGCELISFG